MRKAPKKFSTVGWAIYRGLDGKLWPWSGAFVFRLRREAIAAWTEGYLPWGTCYAKGDRCVEVTVTVSKGGTR